MKTIRISKMSELRNAPVALVGSAQLMVRQLDKLLGYNMRYIDVDSDEAAFKKVQSGQAYAAFTIAGWPHGQITRLTQSSGLTLAEIASRARKIRERTVPIGQFMTSAISS